MNDLLHRVAGCHVLVVGDCMLDASVHGRVRRISPEAPVPVVESAMTHYAPGGAANVAANVVALGGEARLAGVVGDDEDGARLRRLLAGKVDATAVLVEPTRPTTTKLRILAHDQQIVRVDRETREPIDGLVAESLLERALHTLPGVDAVVLSDYAKGVLVPRLLAELIDAARARGMPVIVDPKVFGNGRYSGATVVTPNKHEAAQLVGGADADPDDRDVLARAGKLLLRQLRCDAVLVTRGADGMMFFDAGGPIPIPAEAYEAYDVTGAGDTVVAALALGCAAGAPIIDAARLASAAAGVVVRKLGTAIVTAPELSGALVPSLKAARL